MSGIANAASCLNALNRAQRTNKKRGRDFVSRPRGFCGGVRFGFVSKDYLWPWPLLWLLLWELPWLVL
jgi:hypothetical protein